MERTGLIYMATDKILQMSYIGQTLTTLENRKDQHLKCAMNKKDHTYFSMFYKMIRKLGINNFEWKVLENNIPEKDLNKKEIFYIKKYNTYEDGYNSGPGGQASHNSKLTEKDVEKIIYLLETTDISMKEIAKKFQNCTAENVSDINCGETWRSDSRSYPIRNMGFNKRINFSDEEILEIIKDLKTNLTKKEIAKKHNCNPVTISKINEGKSYHLENISYPIREKSFTKVNDEQISKIIDYLKNTNKSQVEIANLIGCERKVVNNINTGKYQNKERMNKISPGIKFPIRNKK